MITSGHFLVELDEAFPPSILIASVACTISGTDADNNVVTGFPLNRGANPHRFRMVTAVSDTATLWWGTSSSADGR